MPERGPAIHTKARSDLLMPKDSRYGYNITTLARILAENSALWLTDPFDSSTDHAICNLIETMSV